MAITHSFVSAVADGGDTNLVRPTDWNAAHTVTTSIDWSTSDLFLFRDAADTLAQRNSTNAQVFRWYHTFTDTSNYERGFLQWSSNNCQVGTESAGTGTNRRLQLVSASAVDVVVASSTRWIFAANGQLTNSIISANTTIFNLSGGSLTGSNASDFVTFAGTWNTSGTPSALRVNITNTASNAASKLLDLQTANTTRFCVGVGGMVQTRKQAELTIASGAITATGSYHDVDTEADGATDDLDTINGEVDGAILVLRANNDARTVVVKDGTGNLQLAGDMTLDNTQDTITLIFDSTLSAWLEIARSASGA